MGRVGGADANTTESLSNFTYSIRRYMVAKVINFDKENKELTGAVKALRESLTDAEVEEIMKELEKESDEELGEDEQE